MHKEIIPSIIAKSQEELEHMINLVKEKVSIIQLDIMDNKFVNNSSLDFEFRIPNCNCRFEAHLMVNDPITWIEKYGSKVDIIIVHVERLADPGLVINLVRSLEKNVGFALNPETSIDAIKEYLDETDQVLIMTVIPGKYGSEFIPSMVEKIRELRALKPNLNIEVDGSINEETIKLVNDAGANLFVSGSYLLESVNIDRAIEILKKKVE